MNTPRPYIYGVMAEFATAESLLVAAKKTREAGYEKTDAYSPFPIEGLIEAMGVRRTRLPLAVLIAGITGAVLGYTLQYWMNAIDYPIAIAAKPLNSIPAFIPITFECTILFASFTAAFGMMIANRLPSPYHPVFNVDEFDRASRDRFFLCIEAADVKFDQDLTTKFLKTLGAEDVHEVLA